MSNGELGVDIVECFDSSSRSGSDGDVFISDHKDHSSASVVASSWVQRCAQTAILST